MAKKQPPRRNLCFDSPVRYQEDGGSNPLAPTISLRSTISQALDCEKSEQIAHRRIVVGKGSPEESWAK